MDPPFTTMDASLFEACCAQRSIFGLEYDFSRLFNSRISALSLSPLTLAILSLERACCQRTMAAQAVQPHFALR